MSADLLLILPVLIPLAAATLCTIVWGSTRLQAAVTIAAAAALLVVSALLVVRVADGTILVTRFGDWAAPFAIAFAADRLGAAMVLVTGLLGLAVAVYALADVRRIAALSGFYPLYNGLLAGVAGAFLTADLFNLYVWFEVMLIASFGLLVLNKTREQLDGGLKYLALNMLGTLFFLAAIALLYNAAGTLNLADLAMTLQGTSGTAAATAAAWLLLLAFLMKAAAFPLFAWLPASYHTGSIAVAAIFAGLLTKVGVYAIIRIYTLVLPLEGTALQTVLLVVAALTMVTGVFGAAVQWDVRRILSFHIVSQIGYMLLGLALFTPYAIAAAVFYVVHHIIVKANLFLVAGVIGRVGGTYDIRRSGGLMMLSPLLAVLFLIPALSLGGIPPLSGFWAKLMVIDAGLEDEAWIVTAAALAVGLLTLFSMGKIWAYAFWRSPADGRSRPVGWKRMVPIAALAAVTLAIGFSAEPLVAFSLQAGQQLIDPADYIAALTPPIEDTVAENVR
ncbi:proton-conducting transporter transmembrane domain-containing protein [Amorphus orientalis]|uniref:Multicomponent Na+:H+ antiporter subunit D n=1 Tax=Amorphus orientalis TaxID=649198 RepID=A0AAE4ATP0_9HYPH|nr:proton-conducting transporter membrane subunit [Amorphus orientalis]MDQ0317486.1 multicomponent Na+:H+ antiporter subunit D [Amorphus orientalis]